MREYLAFRQWTPRVENLIELRPKLHPDPMPFYVGFWRSVAMTIRRTTRLWPGWLVPIALLFATVGAARQEKYRSETTRRSPLRASSSRRFRTSRSCRHGRRAAHPRRRRRHGTVQSVEPRVSAGRQHARHRARRPAADHSQRRARSEAGRRRARPSGRMGLTGLMDVVLHPRFAENQFVYLTYTSRSRRRQSTLALARGRWNGSALTDVADIFVAGPGTGGASRLAFARDGTLFMTTGGGGGTARRIPTATAARCCGCGTTAACRPTTRSSGAPATSRRSIRSGTATRSAWPSIRRPATCGRTRTARTAATRST